MYYHHAMSEPNTEHRPETPTEQTTTSGETSKHVREIDYDSFDDIRPPSPILADQMQKQRDGIPSHPSKLASGYTNSSLEEKLKQAHRQRFLNCETSMVSEPRRTNEGSENENPVGVHVEKQDEGQSRGSEAPVDPDVSNTLGSGGVEAFNSMDLTFLYPPGHASSTDDSILERDWRWRWARGMMRRIRIPIQGWDGALPNNAHHPRMDLLNGTVWIRRTCLFCRWHRCFARIVEPYEFTWSHHTSTRPHILLLTGVRVVDMGVKVVHKKMLHVMELNFKRSTGRYRVALRTIEDFNNWKEAFERCSQIGV